MGKKNPLRIVGITEDGKKVIGGLFEAHDTLGMPLSVSFGICDSNDYVPSITDYVDRAIEAGWKEKTIIDRYREASINGFNTKWWKEVEPKLTWYIKHKT